MRQRGLRTGDAAAPSAPVGAGELGQARPPSNHQQELPQRVRVRQHDGTGEQLRGGRRCRVSPPSSCQSGQSGHKCEFRGWIGPDDVPNCPPCDATRGCGLWGDPRRPTANVLQPPRPRGPPAVHGAPQSTESNSARRDVLRGRGEARSAEGYTTYRSLNESTCRPAARGHRRDRRQAWRREPTPTSRGTARTHATFAAPTERTVTCVPSTMGPRPPLRRVSGGPVRRDAQ